MNKIFKVLILGLSALLLTGCFASMVTKPAAEKINSVAVVSIASRAALINEKTKKTDMVNSGKYVLSIVKPLPEMITTALSNVKGWTAKHPDTFVNSQPFQDFNASIDKIWGGPRGFSSVTPYGDAMPQPPAGIVLFAKGKIAATNKEYMKICKALGVDAVAMMTVTYNYDLKKRIIGSNSIAPAVNLTVNIINKDGKEAVLHRGIGVESDQEINVTNRVILYTLDENPVEAYTATVKKALDKMVQKINEGLL